MAFHYQRGLRFFLAVGILLRLLRYLLCFPLWGDEAMLAVNFIDRPWSDVAAPLERGQVAPVGFVALEMLAVELLGFSEYSLRLIPLLASVASLYLFFRLVRKTMPEQAAFFAMAFLAVAYVPLRMATDAKPYSVDLLVSVLLLHGLAAILRHRERSTWLIVLACFAPAGIWFSFPAAFVGGAVVVTLLYRAVRDRDARLGIGALAVGGLLLASFAIMVRISGQSQMNAHGSLMQQYWADFFPPPLADFAAWPAWLFSVHTNSTFGYPIGGEGGASLPVTILAICGFWHDLRANERHQRDWAWRDRARLVLSVFAIAFVAAWLRKYPYGVPRLSQYLAPLVCIAAGNGLAVVLEHLSRWFAALRERPLLWPERIGWACSAMAVAIGGHMIVKPYGSEFDYRHRAFARDFWRQWSDKPVVCMIADGDGAIVPHEDESYRCAERIYRRSIRPARDHQGDVYCVVFQSRHAAWNQSAYQRWWRTIEADYEVADRKEFVTCAAGPGEQDLYRVLVLRRRQLDAEREHWIANEPPVNTTR